MSEKEPFEIRVKEFHLRVNGKEKKHFPESFCVKLTKLFLELSHHVYEFF